MQSKTYSFSILKEKERFLSIIQPLVKTIKWKWVSIFLLGISANTLINIIFDYKYQRPLVSISFEEYVNAIIASWFLLGGARWVSRILDTKMPWQDGINRRSFKQFGLQLLLSLVLLNTLVVGITYFFYGGFYTFDEMVVINLSMLSLTMFFSAIDTGIYFSKNWNTLKPNKTHNEVDQRKPIYITLGKIRHLVKQENILTARSESGSVIITTIEKRNLVYSQSLDTLTQNLDPAAFFRANRQTVVSHSIVQSIKSLDYGKVEVALLPTKGQPDSVIISRTKASEFRKWLKLQTT